MSVPSLRQIADEAGISIVTVSRILNGKYAGTTPKGRRRIEQVRGIAQRLGYRGDMAASAMRTGRTRLVGVAVHRDSILCHPVLTEVLSGISETLEAAGHSVVLLRLSQSDGGDLAGHSSLGRRALDGMIVIDGIDDAALAELAQDLPATVQVNARPADGLWVAPDDEQTSRLAGSTLAERGYARAVFVRKQPSEHASYDLRQQGFSAGFGADGRSVEHLPVTLSLREVDLGRIEACCAADRVLVASDPTTALALADALAHLGLRAGIDVGLAALDSMWGMFLSHPRLSRICYERPEMGRMAAELLLDVLADEPPERRQVLFPGWWHAGATAPGPR